MSSLNSHLRTRRFSEVTFRPSRHTKHWKTQHFATSLTFRACWSSFFPHLLIFFLAARLFQLSILSEVRLLNFLWLTFTVNHTLPETNQLAPENWRLEDDPFPGWMIFIWAVTSWPYLFHLICVFFSGDEIRPSSKRDSLRKKKTDMSRLFSDLEFPKLIIPMLLSFFWKQTGSSYGFLRIFTSRNHSIALPLVTIPPQRRPRQNRRPPRRFPPGREAQEGSEI